MAWEIFSRITHRTLFFFYYINIFISINGIRLWSTNGRNIYFHLKNSTDNQTISSGESSIEYKIRGINWFGMNNDCLVVNGLWIKNMESYLDMLVQEGFNSLRIPFSMESVFHIDMPIKQDCVTKDTNLMNKTVRSFLHELFGACLYRNMTILLDFHSIYNVITEYPWFSPLLSKDDFWKLWKIIIDEYAIYPNLIGIDIKNEPHGSIQWPEWSEFIDNFIQNVIQQTPHFQGLVFVEGIQDHEDHSVWGGSFRLMPEPFFTNLSSTTNFLVLSPHIYGVSIRGVSAMYDTSLVWDIWFANRREQYPICIGELGGMFIDEDWDWQQRLLYYLIDMNIQNFYFWSLTPNSYDVGGLLQLDWQTFNTRKLFFCKLLQPEPTFSIDFFSIGHLSFYEDGSFII